MSINIRSVISTPRTEFPVKVDPTCYLTQRLRVAAYCRVSTELESQQSSFDTQVAYYSHYIESNPNWELVEIYADDGISGSQIYWRNGFSKMIEDAQNHKFDLLLTKSVSRFARNTVDSIQTIRDLKELNIDVYFEDRNIHTMHTDGELMLTIFSAFAQEELRSLSSSVTWGYEKKFKKGETIIPSNMLGFHHQKGTKEFSIIRPEARTVRLLYQLRLELYTGNMAKSYLEKHHIPNKKGNFLWYVSTIYSIWENEKYAGDSLLQKTVSTDYLKKSRKKNHGLKKQFYYQDTHPAIVPRDVFELVQEINAQEKMSKTLSRKKLESISTDKEGYYSSKYYLANIMYCKCCGSLFQRFTWTARGNTKYMWMCKIRKKKGGRSLCPQSPSIEEKDLQEAILTAIRKYAALDKKQPDECDFSEEIDRLNKEINTLEIVEEPSEDVLDDLSIKKLERAKFRYLSSNKYPELLSEQLKNYDEEIVKKLICRINVSMYGTLDVCFFTDEIITVDCKCNLK